MEISGKVIAVLPIATGEGKNGTWTSQDYVLETGGQYPKKVCFNLFGDKIDQFLVSIDDNVTVSFEIDSREYNGRWYTSIKAWKVDKNSSSNPTPPPFPVAPPAPSIDANPSEGSDLPF